MSAPNKLFVFFLLLILPLFATARLFPVSVYRMTNDSDIIFLGRSSSQKILKSKFVAIDYYKKLLKLDVAITEFKIIKKYKGDYKGGEIYICSPLELEYYDFIVNEDYMIFAKKTGKAYVPTYAITSVVRMDHKDYLEYYFYSDAPYFNSLFLLEEKVRELLKKKPSTILLSEPYTMYDSVLVNPCW